MFGTIYTAVETTEEDKIIALNSIMKIEQGLNDAEKFKHDLFYK